MKKYALLLVLIFFFGYINAQNCKYLANKVSGMDGSRLVITLPSVLSGNFNEGFLEVWSTIKGDTSLVLAFVVNSNLPLKVSSGDSITLELENNERVYLSILQDASSAGNDLKKLTAMTLANAADIKRLESNLVKHIKIPSNLGNLEGNPGNKRQAAAIRTVSGCVKVYLAGTSQ
jgi:hypothetical protein